MKREVISRLDYNVHVQYTVLAYEVRGNIRLPYKVFTYVDEDRGKVKSLDYHTYLIV